jgi:hypothetical protein
MRNVQTKIDPGSQKFWMKIKIDHAIGSRDGNPLEKLTGLGLQRNSGLHYPYASALQCDIT